MPNSVYNFFIHYIRKDGSYTNGYQLKNDVRPDAIINSVSMTGSNSVDVQLSKLTSLKERTSSSTSGNDRDFTSLLSIDALKDKYAYEVVSTAVSPSDSNTLRGTSLVIIKIIMETFYLKLVLLIILIIMIMYFIGLKLVLLI